MVFLPVVKLIIYAQNHINLPAIIPACPIKSLFYIPDIQFVRLFEKSFQPDTVLSGSEAFIYTGHF